MDKHLIDCNKKLRSQLSQKKKLRSQDRRSKIWTVHPARLSTTTEGCLGPLRCCRAYIYRCPDPPRGFRGEAQKPQSHHRFLAAKSSFVLLVRSRKIQGNRSPPPPSRGDLLFARETRSMRSLLLFLFALQISWVGRVRVRRNADLRAV
jgi:hypothetical protein